MQEPIIEITEQSILTVNGEKVELKKEEVGYSFTVPIDEEFKVNIVECKESKLLV